MNSGWLQRKFHIPQHGCHGNPSQCDILSRHSRYHPQHTACSTARLHEHIPIPELTPGTNNHLSQELKCLFLSPGRWLWHALHQLKANQEPGEEQKPGGCAHRILGFPSLLTKCNGNKQQKQAPWAKVAVEYPCGFSLWLSNSQHLTQAMLCGLQLGMGIEKSTQDKEDRGINCIGGPLFSDSFGPTVNHRILICFHSYCLIDRAVSLTSWTKHWLTTADRTTLVWTDTH